MMPGGHSAPHTDADGLDHIKSYQAVVEAHTGTSYATFEPVSYTTQVVAGTNYKAKVHIGDGQYIHVKIHQPLPHTGNPAHVMEHSSGHTADEAF